MCLFTPISANVGTCKTHQGHGFGFTTRESLAACSFGEGTQRNQIKENEGLGIRVLGGHMHKQTRHSMVIITDAQGMMGTGAQSYNGQ